MTWAGEPLASRMAGSLLRTVGLDELITWNAADYVRKAVDLLSRPEQLAELRARLAEREGECPCNEEGGLIVSYSRSVRVAGVRNGEVGGDLSYVVTQLAKQAVRDRRERKANDKAKRAQTREASACAVVAKVGGAGLDTVLKSISRLHLATVVVPISKDPALGQSCRDLCWAHSANVAPAISTMP